MSNKEKELKKKIYDEMMQVVADMQHCLLPHLEDLEKDFENISDNTGMEAYIAKRHVKFSIHAIRFWYELFVEDLKLPCDKESIDDALRKWATSDLDLGDVPF